MELQKLNVKFFAELPNTLPLADFIEIFHGWIQATDGVYHDVADYSHMQAGPGIVLVANDANVSVDETENRRGLLFSQKSPLSGSNQERLRTVFRAALENCRKLEDEPALRGKLRFAANEAVVSLNDRLLGSNSQESFDDFQAEIEALAKQLYGDAQVSFERDSDARQRLNVHLKTSAAVGLRQALDNLQRHYGVTTKRLDMTSLTAQKIPDDETLPDLAQASAETVLGWAFESFSPRIALACSFQAEESVLIDMMHRLRGADFRIFTLDTGRLNQETYDCMDAIRVALRDQRRSLLSRSGESAGYGARDAA